MTWRISIMGRSLLNCFVGLAGFADIIEKALASVSSETERRSLFLRQLLSAEKGRLRGWSPEGSARYICALGPLIKPEPFGVDLEQLVNRFPILTLAAHSFTEDSRIYFAFAGLAHSIHDAISFGRKFFPQLLLKVGSDASR